MNVYESRLQNLVHYLNEFKADPSIPGKKTNKAFSEMLGISVRRFSNIIKKRINIGSRSAREIERILKLDDGKFDTPIGKGVISIASEDEGFYDWCTKWKNSTCPDVIRAQKIFIKQTESLPAYYVAELVNIVIEAVDSKNTGV